jgi:putative ABC transport system permease protein
MFDIAMKNLSTRKVRTALCIFAVTAGVFLIGVTLVMNNWMYSMMTEELAKYMGKLYVQQGGSSYPPFDSSLSQMVADAILNRGDLDLNIGNSTDLIFVRTQRGMMPFMPAQQMVIGVPAGKEPALFGTISASRGVNHFEPNEQGNVAILGSEFAKDLTISIGGETSINGQMVHVVGRLEKSSMDSINISAIIPLEAAQRIFSKQGQVSSILLTPNDFHNTSAIAASLREDYPSLSVVTQDDMLKEAEAVMQMPIFYMSSMGITGLIVAMLIIMSTMFMAISERTREFGTLRAIGAQRYVIIGTVMIEALIMALIGVPPAIGLVAIMSRMMETSLPTTAQLLQIISAAVFAAGIGGAYPALRAARVEPLEALRYE